MQSRLFERNENAVCVCVPDKKCCVHIPFPLDHFFFCFLPPVAAGAWNRSVLSLYLNTKGSKRHTILSDVVDVLGQVSWLSLESQNARVRKWRSQDTLRFHVTNEASSHHT